LSADVGLSLH